MTARTGLTAGKQRERMLKNQLKQRKFSARLSKVWRRHRRPMEILLQSSNLESNSS